MLNENKGIYHESICPDECRKNNTLLQLRIQGKINNHFIKYIKGMIH